MGMYIHVCMLKYYVEFSSTVLCNFSILILSYSKGIGSFPGVFVRDVRKSKPAVKRLWDE
jgi:hypothetical protein